MVPKNCLITLPDQCLPTIPPLIAPYKLKLLNTHPSVYQPHLPILPGFPSIDIFTDAALDTQHSLTQCSIVTNQNDYLYFTPYGTISSTNLELQAILEANQKNNISIDSS
jgi:hypothetical protein